MTNTLVIGKDLTIFDYSVKQKGYGRQGFYIEFSEIKGKYYVRDVYPNVVEHYNILLEKDAFPKYRKNDCQNCNNHEECNRVGCECMECDDCVFCACKECRKCTACDCENCENRGCEDCGTFTHYTDCDGNGEHDKCYHNIIEAVRDIFKGREVLAEAIVKEEEF